MGDVGFGASSAFGGPVLAEVEFALLCRTVPQDNALKHLRNRALPGLQPLHTVEITRRRPAAA